MKSLANKSYPLLATTMKIINGNKIRSSSWKLEFMVQLLRLQAAKVTLLQDVKEALSSCSFLSLSS